MILPLPAARLVRPLGATWTLEVIVPTAPAGTTAIDPAVAAMLEPR